jgi:hypothetical protein
LENLTYNDSKNFLTLPLEEAPLKVYLSKDFEKVVEIGS